MKTHTLPDGFLFPTKAISDKRLTPTQIRVLSGICSYLEPDANLQPKTMTVKISRQMISDRVGYPLTRISKATTSLAKLGWIKKTGDGGNSQWCEYEILDPKLENKRTKNEHKTADKL